MSFNQITAKSSGIKDQKILSQALQSDFDKSLVGLKTLKGSSKMTELLSIVQKANNDTDLKKIVNALDSRRTIADITNPKLSLQNFLKDHIKKEMFDNPEFLSLAKSLDAKKASGINVPFLREWDADTQFAIKVKDSHDEVKSVTGMTFEEVEKLEPGSKKREDYCDRVEKTKGHQLLTHEERRAHIKFIRGQQAADRNELAMMRRINKAFKDAGLITLEIFDKNEKFYVQNEKAIAVAEAKIKNPSSASALEGNQETIENIDIAKSIKQYTSAAIDILLKSDSKQKIDQLLLETRKLINKLFEYEDKARKENKIESNKEETKKTEARIEENRIASSKNLNSVNKLFTVMENIEKMAAKYTDQNLTKVLSNIKTEMNDVSKRTNLSETEKLTMMTDLLNQVLKKVLENNEEKKLDNKNPLDEKEIKKTVADVFSRLGAVFGLASGRKLDNSTQQVLSSLETGDSNSKSKRAVESILNEIKVTMKYVFDELKAHASRNDDKDEELFLRRILNDINKVTAKSKALNEADLNPVEKVLKDLEKFGSKIDTALEKNKA